MRGIFRLLATLIGISLCLFVVVLTIIGIKRVVFGSGTDFSKPHVEIMDLSGVIVSSTQFLKDLRENLENKSVKCILVRVNSPGGLVAPSQEIFEALKRADEKVPVVVSMASLAASGGYYVALAGRKIFANPGTMTGSIGVIMEFINTEKLYQWAKMDRFNLKSGRYKDIGSPLRPMKPDEKALLDTMLTDIHTQFKTAVKTRRNMTDENVDKVADGRILTGSQAKQAGLVDELYDFEIAVKEAKKIASLPEDAPVHFPENRSSFLKRLVFDDPENASGADAITQVLDPLVSSGRPGWQVLLLAPVR